jgi:Mycothiol maleylpyruvate isomerase N-terminal domain
MQTTVGNAWEIPQTPPGRVAEVAMAELEAELVLLGTLEGQDWRRPTDCASWDVHDLTAHLACEYEEIFRPGALLRRLRKGHRRYPRLSRLDAHNQQQIDELGDQSGPELIATLARLAPKAIRAQTAHTATPPQRRLPLALALPCTCTGNDQRWLLQRRRQVAHLLRDLPEPPP